MSKHSAKMSKHQERVNPDDGGITGADTFRVYECSWGPLFDASGLLGQKKSSEGSRSSRPCLPLHKEIVAENNGALDKVYNAKTVKFVIATN